VARRSSVSHHFRPYFDHLLLGVLTYPSAEKLAGRLVALYIAVTLLYANIYMQIALLAGKSAIDGIHEPWHWLSASEGRRLYWPNVINTAVDCFHFSCVTISTVGYGDMRPVTVGAKLLCDSEILVGVAILVVGFGRFFSRRTAA
jgi:hypothetical protein